MNEPMSTRQGDPLVGEVRVRAPLPLIIPLGALILVGALAWGFSRLLLAEHEAATAVALLTAANILGVCTVIALRPNLNRTALIELLIVASYPLLIGFVIAQVGLPEIGEAAATEEGAAEETGVAGAGSEAEGGGPTSEVTAAGNAFDTDTITLVADQETTIEFVNDDDGVPHNISIYEDDSAAQDLFVGEETNGGSLPYDIPAIPAGEYYFQCDFHPPSMNGTLVVE